MEASEQFLTASTLGHCLGITSGGQCYHSTPKMQASGIDFTEKGTKLLLNSFFFTKSYKKICTYQKKVLILHAKLENMEKRATTIEQQISLLRSRGMEIKDEEKAKEILLDIGYYRLCFYAFPFEESYPKLSHRNHQYRKGVTIEDVVALYYFDFDLRKILLPYLIRIEVKLRTQMVLLLSNLYVDNPLWFVESGIVNSDFINTFDAQVYDAIRKNPIIKRHHKLHPAQQYAPAWKTIEFMTLGNVVCLFDNLCKPKDQQMVSQSMGVNAIGVFSNYLEAIRSLRNACAHGMVLYDYNLPKSIFNGPAGIMDINTKHSLGGLLKVTHYLLKQVSQNRANDMTKEVEDAFRRLTKNSPVSAQKVIDISGISI